jgi:peroxiredoxin Q/BCP
VAHGPGVFQNRPVKTLARTTPPLDIENRLSAQPRSNPSPKIAVRTGLSLQITRENKTMKLKIGDPAPQFNATVPTAAPSNYPITSGRKLVLYFYPMDDTPGCTKQACSLRDHYQDIQAKDASILGVSTQDVASHQRFTEKYNLSFPLVADTDGAVSRAYGAIGGSGLMGNAMSLFGVANRITFIIDESGHIAHIIDQPDTAHHAEEILKLL